MRPSAKYRHSETSYISRNDHFAAMQIDLSVRGWIGAFAAPAVYAIPISSRTMSFPVDSTGGNLRQSPLPKTGSNNSTSGGQKQSKTAFSASRFERCKAKHCAKRGGSQLASYRWDK